MNQTTKANLWLNNRRLRPEVVYHLLGCSERNAMYYESTRQSKTKFK